LANLKGIDLSHKITEFLFSIRTRIEIGRNAGQSAAKWSQIHPTIFSVHQSENFLQNRGRRIRELGRLHSCGGTCIMRVTLITKIFRVDEAVASLAKAFGGFLFAKSEDLDSLLSDTRRQAREIAIRRHKAEAIAAAAVQKVHRVNDERNV
jgi:hypothetical protein